MTIQKPLPCNVLNIFSLQTESPASVCCQVATLRETPATQSLLILLLTIIEVFCCFSALHRNFTPCSPWMHLCFRYFDTRLNSSNMRFFRLESRGVSCRRTNSLKYFYFAFFFLITGSLEIWKWRQWDFECRICTVLMGRDFLGSQERQN